MPSAARVLLLAVLAAGCGEPTYPPSPRRPPNPGCVALPPPPRHERLRLVRALEGILDGGDARAATHLVAHPSDPGTFFLTVQGGRVLSIAGGESKVVYDVSDRADFSFGENGLVSIALSPRFAEDGFAYIVYSAPSDSAPFLSRLSRIRWDGAAFGDESVILEVDQYVGTHSGNHVAFGQDGFLYYSIGDDRQTAHHASPHTLPGSVLRLDVAVAPYRVPPDNPFADGVDAAPEVYAYGFRNPWRFLFETDGTLLLGDVGQDAREEISAVVRGGDHGWPTREGTLCFQQPSPCGDASLVDPLVEVTHADARSIVPGYRFEGRTTFADFNSGTVFSFDEGRSPPDVRVEIEGRFSIVSFERAPDGTIYAVRYDPSGDEGGVYRLELAGPAGPSEFPRLLSETGCVDPADPHRPAAGLFEFAPEAELFSDGATKSRWLAIPDDARIEVTDDGDLELPVGSVVAKHFGFGERVHETRLLMRTTDGWAGYSYRWNEAGTDAELLDAGLVEDLPGTRVRWSYPRRSQCPECHTAAAGYTLGLEVRQLDDLELTQLHEQDYLRPGTDAASLRARHPLLADPAGDASVASRARAYLHANCAHCHRPEGPGGGDMDLRATASFSEMRVCDVEPLTRVWDVGVWDEQRLFAPGMPDRSTIHLRVSTLGLFRMPPLASNVVDDAAAELLGAWISETRTCD